MIDEIQYPNGGEIHYTWGLNPQSEPAQLETWNGSQYQRCSARFDNPVLTERDVYVNGTEVERQQFQYATTWYTGTDENFWTNKQTVVTDTDEATGAVRTLTYNYVNAPEPSQPHSGAIIAPESPVEQSVVTTSGGATLQTISESWSGYPFLPTLRQTARNGWVKESDYAYETSGDATMQLTQEDNYDWGSGAHGGLLRQINVNYAGFSGSNIVDRPSSVVTYSDAGQTRVAETDYSYDQSTPAATSGIAQHFAPPEGSRGNLTTISRWLNKGNPSVTTLAYDDTGQMLSQTDPNGNTTSYSYTDENTYVTTIAPPDTPGCPSGVNCHLEHYTWFYAGGNMASRTDSNGNATSYVFNDPWDRLTEIAFPDGGETSYAYTDATLETRRLKSGSTWTDQLDTFDGLDRLAVSAHTNGNGDWDRVETCYNGFGDKDYVTYPFESSAAGGAAACTQPGDSYQMDALGRITKITHADGSYATTLYTGPATETADAGDGAGSVATIRQTNGLGQLAAVCEVTSVTGSVPNSTPADCNQQISGVSLAMDATGFLTAYQRDARGLLTEVEQPGLANRVFTWDSLSRLLTASNPETGMTSYGYDPDSNLASKTMADGVVTSYSYDALNRPTGHSFTVNGTADPADTVTLSYDTDPTGLTTYGAYNHLTRVTNGSPVALSFNQYDAMGRAQVLDTIINGTTYHASTDYDTIGFPTYERYPSGRVLYLDNDVADRTTWIQDQDAANTTYVEDRYYTPWGAADDSDLGNGDTQVWHHDSRMRLTATDVHPAGDYNWDDQLLYVQYAYNPDSTVASLSDEMGTSAQDLTFTYDPLGRLSAWSTGAGLNCTFGVDRYGNLVDTSGNSACGMLTGRQANADNQIAGDIYNASGLPLSDTAGTSYSWNVEGELSGFQQSGEPAYGYVYDGLGRRVEKLENGTVTAVYLRNAQGEMVSELDGTQFTDSIISPSDGDRIAAVLPDGSVDYYHDGALGTTRAITNSSGANILSCGQSSQYPGASMLTYAPFGAEVGGCTQAALPYKFTGKYRDSESTLDYFGARYYQSDLGRFLSPDWSATPEAVPYANLAQPQSLNLYAYEGDNPTSRVDKDGHCWPWCTALAGAAIGAVVGGGAEAIAEYWRGQPLNKSEIEHAAIGGAISGAIIGAVGPEAAPEAGLDEAGGGILRKIGGAVLGNLVGGAAERKLNGQPVVNPKALAIDAGTGLTGGAAAAVASKTVASTLIREGVTDLAGLGTSAAIREAPEKPACKENAPCARAQNSGTAGPAHAGGGAQ